MHPLAGGAPLLSRKKSRERNRKTRRAATFHAGTWSSLARARAQLREHDATFLAQLVHLLRRWGRGYWLSLDCCGALALPPEHAVPPGNTLLAFGLRFSERRFGLVWFVVCERALRASLRCQTTPHTQAPRWSGDTRMKCLGCGDGEKLERSSNEKRFSA
jgi:hypothetical protein